MKTKKIAILLSVALMCILLGLLIFSLVRSAQDEKIPFDQEKFYQVASVLDGDTFKVKTEKEIITVRMLGINTPETVDPRKPPECFGVEASEETKSLLSRNLVQLKLSPKREIKDRYGRYLAYVYRDDGLFVNEYLIKEGFAREYTYGTAYSLQREFRAIEKGAQKKVAGLWKEC